MVILYLTTILLLLYYSLLQMSVQSWTSPKAMEKSVAVNTQTITVIIAARNEVSSIFPCVKSILKNSPAHLLAEIIVVDDHSDDHLSANIKKWNLPKVRYLALPEEKNGKKAAITLGVTASTSEIIAVTDADCQPGEAWLATMASYFATHENSDMITGLVLPVPIPNLMGRFQWLDFAATMSLTRLGIHQRWFFLANGANMAFRKSAFQSVQGFQGNEHVASGDDVFLVSKMASQTGRQVKFMHDRQALVTTKSESSWSELWHQRKRWAQKTKAYASRNIIMIQGLVFVLCLLWWISIPGAFIGKQSLVYLPVIAGAGKMAIDYWFLSRLSQYFGQPNMLTRFPLSWLLYQVYIILMGFTALFPGTYRWKNRASR